METIFRIAIFVVGLSGLIVFVRSIAHVALLNRRQKDPIAAEVGRWVRVAVTARARSKRSYGAVQRTMAWAFPLFNLTLIAAWFFLVQSAYSLMIWAIKPGMSLGKAFIASGSALSTLGFATPPDAFGQLLAIAEGATGLGIVVFMFTFIPGYASAVEAREDKVGWLYARAGSHPTIASFLEWNQKAGCGDDMTAIWNDWEGWFRGILETHSLTPLLALVPSIYEGRTWVGAATVMLDTASVVLTSVDAKGLESARLCHETGVRALRIVAGELPAGRDVEESRETNLSTQEAAFDVAYERLALAGVAVRPQRDECRRAFLALRAQYEASARRIASAAVMPINEPWVIPRQAQPGSKQEG